MRFDCNSCREFMLDIMWRFVTLTSSSCLVVLLFCSVALLSRVLEEFCCENMLCCFGKVHSTLIASSNFYVVCFCRANYVLVMFLLFFYVPRFCTIWFECLLKIWVAIPEAVSQYLGLNGNVLYVFMR